MKKNILISISFYTFLVIYSLIGSKMIQVDNGYQIDLIKNIPPLLMIILFLIGSLVETFVFNFLIFYFFIKKVANYKKYKIIIILIASMIFGFGHFSSFSFFIITSIVGFILNINFLIFYEKKNSFALAFFSTFLIHFLSNSTVYLISEYLNLI